MKNVFIHRPVRAGIAVLSLSFFGCSYTEPEIAKGMRDCRGAVSISCVDAALAYANLQREKQLQATEANRQDIVAVLGQAKYDEMISIMKDAQSHIESARPNFLIRNLYPMGDGTSYMLAFSSFDGDERLTELASEYARLTANKQPENYPPIAQVPATNASAPEVDLKTDLADLPDAHSSGQQSDSEIDSQPELADNHAVDATPSFDCTRASTAAERMVCNYPNLAVLDRQLANTYRQAMDYTPNKQALKEQQRDWIQRHRDTCLTPECVQYVYEERLESLAGSMTNSGQ